MSDREVMSNLAIEQAPAPAALRQRIESAVSPEGRRVLDLRYEPQHGVLMIGCLGVPCWMQPVPDGSPAWVFGCPWWHSLLAESPLFEATLLTELGKVKLHVDGMLEKLDPSKVN